MTWFRTNAVGIAAVLLSAVTGGCVAYAATESRNAVQDQRLGAVEEKADANEEVRDNMIIMCTFIGAPCKWRRR